MMLTEELKKEINDQRFTSIDQIHAFLKCIPNMDTGAMFVLAEAQGRDTHGKIKIQFKLSCVFGDKFEIENINA
jgi:hypothetical protein